MYVCTVRTCLVCRRLLSDRSKMNRCRLAFRGRSTSQPTTTFMSPSSIHHLHAELAVAELCSDITHAVATCHSSSKASASSGVAELVATAASNGDVAGLPALRVQAVEKDGCWFALDSAQLELCRRLERGGVCRQVHKRTASATECVFHTAHACGLRTELRLPTHPSEPPARHCR